VEQKGIEPSTLSLQGRNASLGTCCPSFQYFFYFQFAVIESLSAS